MDKIFGFIGAGNMGGALAKAAAVKIPGENILISNRTQKKADDLAKQIGARTFSNKVLAATSHYIFLGVKPQMLAELFEEIRPVLEQREGPFVLVSMAAGVSMARICELAGRKVPVIRIMPNTPCAVGEGITLICRNELVSDEDYKFFKYEMSGAGQFLELGENLFDAGCAVSGCGPAFVAMFIEAMADGGVRCGLPRKAATDLAAQTLIGTAKLLQKSGKHPGLLKDEVCSPGGATIEGVLELEAAGFRDAVSAAVIAACEKSKKLG